MSRLTSNLAFGEWGQIFQGERMTAALLDRLTHRVQIVEANGESFRLRESSEGLALVTEGEDRAACEDASATTAIVRTSRAVRTSVTSASKCAAMPAQTPASLPCSGIRVSRRRGGGGRDVSAPGTSPGSGGGASRARSRRTSTSDDGLSRAPSHVAQYVTPFFSSKSSLFSWFST